ncbi:MAG: hypothetical protein ABH867_00470 [Patescibacteria group bacterium]|nr:hypothetical protein [Patescibacteria group bacterium]
MAFLISGGRAKQRQKETALLIKKLAISSIKNNPDVLVLKPEKSIGIEEVRRVKTFLSKKSWQEKLKLVIVEEAQTMTLEAQNAFLKTLEEPPKNSEIILISNNRDSLLPTVVSRCRIIEIIAKAGPRLSGYWKNWQAIVKMPLDQKLSGFSFKDQTELEQWLKGFIFCLQRRLVKSQKPKTEIARWLRLLISSRQMLKDHVGNQKIVDWLMIKI